MHDLNDALKRCLAACDECGIPYGRILSVKSSTASTRHGSCSAARGGGGFRIRVHASLLDERTPQRSLDQVLLHEICHTVPGGMNHGPAWKAAVDSLNRRFGYDIRSRDDASALGCAEARADIERSFPYRITCTRCGATVYRKTRSTLVTRTSRYRCAKCGGTLKLTEQ